MTTARMTVATALAVAALAGCGIRPTSLPVDAGPAPSRVACAVRGGDTETRQPGQPEPNGETGETTGAVEVRISLVCSSRVVDVERRVELPRSDSARARLTVARKLLDELRREPGEEERKAGFITAVPDGLRVSEPAEGDDKSALRLSQQPDRLPSFALAQIVCSYAGTRLADMNRQVLLGGPADEDATSLRLYECGTALRTTTEAAETAGVPF
ncbi:hypothetical protein [Streptomyces gobiensis]|uniref:hypothetical protein n=1 Tax=Streptomyces gobiensis TaxID=2875706 RepID=UPI001E3F6D15|nr:hypothetical protein [Streptomyces gobiensis]UGY93290.1 hypothetical protein test1122_17260 [Streptomyces gobiensis]